MSNPFQMLADLLAPPLPLIPELQALKADLSIGPYAEQCAKWEAKARRKGRRSGIPDIEESALVLLRQKMDGLVRREVAQAAGDLQVTVVRDPEELRDRVRELELKQRTEEGLTADEEERLERWRAELKSHRDALAQEVKEQSSFSKEQAAREAEQKRLTIPDSVRAETATAGYDLLDLEGFEL